MTDDFRPAGDERDVAVIDGAMRLARQISRALGARGGRPPSDDAERAAILREAFDYAADMAPIEFPEGR